MSPTAAPPCAPVELSSRASDGIEVTLLWSPDSNRLTVAVVDTKLNTCFQLEPAPHEAWQVFEHPFAWAAARGVDGCHVDAREPDDSGVRAETLPADGVALGSDPIG